MHWSEGRRPGDVLLVTLCGQLVTESALTHADVTCKKCRRAIDGTKPDRAEAYVSAIVDRGIFDPDPPQPLVHPISGMPVVTRFTWPTIRDRRHWCTHCEVCSWYNSIEAEHNARPWTKRHRTSAERYRWPSVSGALEWYVNLRIDGYSVGTLGEALAKIGKLGTLIRAGGNSIRASEEADDAHLIEQALARCYTTPSRRGLTRTQQLYCLFQSSVHGTKAHVIAARLRNHDRGLSVLTGPMVAAVVTQGRWQVYERLRTEGMIPAKRKVAE